MASAPPFTGVEEELECPICRELFTDPVTLECGHNYCRGCITEYCDKWEDLGDLNCPLCGDRIKGRKNVRTNYVVSNVVERVRQAKKHLCGQHMKETSLFCKEDDALVCVACETSPEHASHTLLPLETAAEEYKEKIQAQLQSLEEEKGRLVKLERDEEQRSQKCLEVLMASGLDAFNRELDRFLLERSLSQVADCDRHFEVEKQEITSVFGEMRRFLLEKEHLWLTQLADLENEIKNWHDGNMFSLSLEISHFSRLIADVEAKCQQPPSEFLLDIRGTLSRCQEGQEREKLELSPGQEWRVRSFCLKGSAFKRAMEEFEGALKKAPSKGNVTLDPRTANPNLLISQDLKSVRNSNSKQDVLDYPERFDVLPCVLGCQTLRSGRHWWEVEVEMPSSVLRRVQGLFINRKRGPWAVGVARESLRRKGSYLISPNEGIWAVGTVSPQPQEVWAFTSNEPTLLTLSRDLRKIRVFLDCKEGSVEFFDADTDDLIFAFPPASFSGETVRPFFRVVKEVSLKF